MGNLHSKGNISGASAALQLECGIAIRAGSRLDDRFDNAVYQLDFLLFRLVQNRIELPSQRPLSLLTFEKQQVMSWDAQRPSHRSDCIQARHLSTSFYFAPIIPTQPCALSSLLQAKLLSLPELPNTLAEQCPSIIHTHEQQ